MSLAGLALLAGLVSGGCKAPTRGWETPPNIKQLEDAGRPSLEIALSPDLASDAIPEDLMATLPESAHETAGQRLAEAIREAMRNTKSFDVVSLQEGQTKSRADYRLLLDVLEMSEEHVDGLSSFGQLEHWAGNRPIFATARLGCILLDNVSGEQLANEREFVARYEIKGQAMIQDGSRPGLRIQDYFAKERAPFLASATILAIGRLIEGIQKDCLDEMQKTSLGPRTDGPR